MRKSGKSLYRTNSKYRHKYFPMLATRRFEPEESHWSSKFKTDLHKANSTRMSSYSGSLSTQPDWQGHYSFLPPVESTIFGQPFEQASSSSNDNDVGSQQRSSGSQNTNLDTHGRANSSTLSSPTNTHRAIDPLGLRQHNSEAVSQEQTSISGTAYAINTEAAHEESLASTKATQATVESSTPISVPSTEHIPHASLGVSDNLEAAVGKEEDEEIVEDDDMIEGDGDVEGDGEDDTPSQPQTAAERTAARRKMKRFR